MKTRRVRIFVDMDGTIADLHAIPDWWERCHNEPDFYEVLDPFPNLITALFLIKVFYGDKVEICSLSAVDKTIKESRAEASKDKWLDTYADFIKVRVFSNLGERKSAAVGKIGKTDILLDDYSKNLFEWVEDGGTAVKIRNNINCAGKNWTGEIIFNQDYVSSIIYKIDKIIKETAGL